LYLFLSRHFRYMILPVTVAHAHAIFQLSAKCEPPELRAPGSAPPGTPFNAALRTSTQLPVPMTEIGVR